MEKLICLDLDGTLLNENNEVSQANIDAIKAAIKLGNKVVLVTGRPNCFTARVTRMLGFDLGQITFNGGHYEIDGIIKNYPIDENITKKIAHLAKKYDVRTFFKKKNLSLCTKSDPKTLDYDDYKDETPKDAQMDMYYDVDVEAWLENNTGEFLKILTWDGENTDAFYEEVSKLDYIKVFKHETYFELCNENTDKGMAVESLANNLNIDLKDVICIGDSYNDLSMFKKAGLSIAMGNADDYIKSQCDHTTLTNNESGVAYAINKWVLNSEE